MKSKMMGADPNRVFRMRVPAICWLALLLSACATTAPPVPLLDERSLPR